MARELLSAGRVQFKNCVLGISELPGQTQPSSDVISDVISDVTSDLQTDTEPEVIDTVQVSDVTSAANLFFSVSLFTMVIAISKIREQ